MSDWRYYRERQRRRNRSRQRLVFERLVHEVECLDCGCRFHHAEVWLAGTGDNAEGLPEWAGCLECDSERLVILGVVDQ